MFLAEKVAGQEALGRGAREVQDRALLTAAVTNTGSVAGKDVVIIMNPWLSAFGKTGLLLPGESETLVLSLPVHYR